MNSIINIMLEKYNPHNNVFLLKLTNKISR